MRAVAQLVGTAGIFGVAAGGVATLVLGIMTVGEAFENTGGGLPFVVFMFAVLVAFGGYIGGGD
ncbi:hypothetical protein M0R89_10465 [Halorussus limi]|uniref:Uncharacterized protein n=1 Tax=Halorussus limi TaxID=2938695 RepID=A0A8U0HQ32_9EURY|nr:hypothetical protein [Halorussus limi]UPV72971.1 hypothetical protein M0R89_10465 [Halorussus limi]